jgi:hypothetical protein
MNKVEDWDRRTRIVLNQGPLQKLNRAGFAKITMKDGNGDDYELGFTNCHIVHL